MRRELIWWTAIGLLSTLIVGLLTKFQFYRLDFQNYDTYYVFESRHAIIFLTIVIGLSRYIYELIDIITNRYKIIALLISIINPIIGLFITFIIYMSLKTIWTFENMYKDGDFTGHYIILSVFIGILTMQTIIEIKMIKKLRGQLN